LRANLKHSDTNYSVQIDAPNFENEFLTLGDDETADSHIDSHCFTSNCGNKFNQHISEEGREEQPRITKKKSSKIKNEQNCKKLLNQDVKMKFQKEKQSFGSFTTTFPFSKSTKIGGLAKELIGAKLAEKLYLAKEIRNTTTCDKTSEKCLVFSQATEFLHTLEEKDQIFSNGHSTEKKLPVKLDNDNEVINSKNKAIDPYSGYFSTTEVNDNIFHEKIIGRGIGPVLEIMRNQGMLSSKNPLSNGTNIDRKVSTIRQTESKVKYTPVMENDTDIITKRVEVALKRTDIYGRLLTVKEAFRELCYHFHGKGPSKNRQQKRINQYVHELMTKKKFTSDLITQQTNNILDIQQKLSTPYLVLNRNSKIIS